MKILGIETSCDETAVAVLEIHPVKSAKPNPEVSGLFDRVKFNLLSNIVSSQVKTHAKYGGIVPEVAARMQMEMILPVIDESLKQAKIKLKDIDQIAVTQGPGLVTSLIVGVETAKMLAFVLNKPLIPVNHLAAHLLVNHLRQPSFASKKSYWTTADRHSSVIKYPAVGLIVSGGHTMLVLIKNKIHPVKSSKAGSPLAKFDRVNFKIIGETQDDAVGEAFDKVAKILDLGYPGGPIISNHATKGDKNKFKLPRPMIQQQNFNFSFSGLKTAVLYLTQDRKFKKTKQNINDLCASFQQACIDVLISKTLRAIKKHKPKSFLLGGGVSANTELRKQLQEKIEKLTTPSPSLKMRGDKTKIFIPELKFTGDNATMIAVARYFQITKTQKTLNHKNTLNLKADPNLTL